MKILLIILMAVGSSCAMHKKAAPMSKAQTKGLSLECLRQKKLAALKEIMLKGDKPYTEEDRPWYFKTAEEKANQYGQSATKYVAAEVAAPSRDHALHEGLEDVSQS